MKPVVGYSGTPLAKKLGITPGSRVVVEHPPADYRDLLTPIPAGVEFEPQLSQATDLVHVFTDSRAELSDTLRRLRTAIRQDVAIWVSWPKKASRVPTDVTEDGIRELALPLGLVDIKVCAVSETWSGLKLVIRKELRTPPRRSEGAKA